MAFPRPDLPRDLRLPELFAGEAWPRLAERLALSRRQLEIARLICRGMSNRQIARELEIGPDAVSKHIQELFSKLRTTGRVGVVVKLVLAGREDLIPRIAPAETPENRVQLPKLVG